MLRRPRCAVPLRVSPSLRLLPRCGLASASSTSSRAPQPKFLRKADRHPAAPQMPASPIPSLSDLLAPSRKGAPPPVPLPVKSFGDLDLHPNVLAKLKELGFTAPTEIQKLGIPPIMRRDSCVVLRAQTGTGKTLAYLLPIFSILQKESKRRPFSALILAPSRELVAQIATIVRQFEDFPVATIIGGPPIQEQVARLRDTKPVVVLANPTRLQEVLEMKDIKSLLVPKLEFLVMDELDHMVPPLGRYAPRRERERRYRHPPAAQLAISTILRGNPTVQSIVVSATASARLLRSLRFNKWAMSPTVVGAAEVFKPPAALKHFYLRCTQAQKIRSMVALLRELKPKNALAIIGTNSGIAQFTRLLKVKNILAEALYKVVATSTGDEDWSKFLERFKSGEIKVVVTTEEMARGLDFSFVDTVFILEPPETHNAYLHLAGRTGRLGRAGSVYSFVDDEEYSRLQRITSELDAPFSEVKLSSPPTAADDLPAEDTLAQSAAPPMPFDTSQILQRPAKHRKAGGL